MQTLQKRNPFHIEDETGANKKDAVSSSSSSLSSSSLLKQKRPLTNEEQGFIIHEAEDSIVFNDKLATTAFTFLMLCEGFVFLFFAVSDLRSYLWRNYDKDSGVSYALRTGGRQGAGGGKLNLPLGSITADEKSNDDGWKTGSIAELFEIASHFVVCILAFFATIRTFKRHSLKRVIVDKTQNASPAGGDDDDDSISISIALNEANVKHVQSVHRRTALLSLILATPLILISAIISGESIFFSSSSSSVPSHRLLMASWQPLQHAVMMWAARSLVADVLDSIEALKKAKYSYQDV